MVTNGLTKTFLFFGPKNVDWVGTIMDVLLCFFTTLAFFSTLTFFKVAKAVFLSLSSFFTSFNLFSASSRSFCCTLAPNSINVMQTCSAILRAIFGFWHGNLYLGTSRTLDNLNPAYYQCNFSLSIQSINATYERIILDIFFRKSRRQCEEQYRSTTFLLHTLRTSSSLFRWRNNILRNYIDKKITCRMFLKVTIVLIVGVLKEWLLHWL